VTGLSRLSRLLNDTFKSSISSRVRVSSDSANEMMQPMRGGLIQLADLIQPLNENADNHQRQDGNVISRCLNLHSIPLLSNFIPATARYARLSLLTLESAICHGKQRPGLTRMTRGDSRNKDAASKPDENTWLVGVVARSILAC
jgi:hypothetical protein